uniref:Uncharacterized protein n=2 Tax=Micrurus TaxID=8634 RepID=A0A2D4ESZ7_MICCO
MRKQIIGHEALSLADYAKTPLIISFFTIFSLQSSSEQVSSCLFSQLCLCRYLWLRRLYQRIDFSPDLQISARLICAPPYSKKKTKYIDEYLQDIQSLIRRS